MNYREIDYKTKYEIASAKIKDLETKNSELNSELKVIKLKLGRIEDIDKIMKYEEKELMKNRNDNLMFTPILQGLQGMAFVLFVALITIISFKSGYSSGSNDRFVRTYGFHQMNGENH